MTLQVQKLTAERNDRCLFSGLDFTLNSGEILQVSGANGAGKTTLLRTVCGLLPAMEGNILWRDQSIYDNREAYFSELLYIGHQSGIKGGLTPQENLQFAAHLAGQLVSGSAIEHALETVGLQEIKHTENYRLSMGQQRRVSLARLALLSFKLWILDEPLAALDTQGIEIVEGLISNHLARQGMVLMTSHQPLKVYSKRLELVA